MAVQFKKRVMTDKVKKKLLDKEIPYSQIPQKDLELYKEAEELEWADWVKRGSVKILSITEPKRLKREMDPARIFGLRFVYRDKNASIRTPHLYQVKQKRDCVCRHSESL